MHNDIIDGLAHLPEADIRMLINRLSNSHRVMIDMLEEGYLLSDIATILKITRIKASAMRDELIKELTILAAKKSIAKGVFIRTIPDEYWREYIRTWKETTPFKDNKYTNAARLRSNNRISRYFCL